MGGPSSHNLSEISWVKFLKTKKSREKTEKAVNFLLDLFFPKFCLGCGAEGSYICSKCQNFISESLSVCPVCGKPSFSGETHNWCQTKYSLDGLTAAWDYEGLVKKLIWEAKIGGYFDIFSEVIERFFRIIISDPRRFSSFLFFPRRKNTYIGYVPITAKKEKERNFNQAEVIADKLSRFIGIKKLPLLKKIKETEDQTNLKKEERFRNVKGVFELNDKYQEAENVLLVDDVFTSGATMQECSRTLKRAGVKEVWGFAIAKTA